MKRKTLEIALSDMHPKQQRKMQAYTSHQFSSASSPFQCLSEENFRIQNLPTTYLQSLASKNILKGC